MSIFIWRLQAACRGADNPQIFFSKGPGDIAAARQCCAGCLVQGECLQLALEVEADENCIAYGMYGGHTPKERKALAS